MMKRAFLVLLGFIYLTLSGLSAAAETVVGDLEARFADVTLEYDGKVYRKRSRVETVLIAGIDKRVDEEPAENEYRNGGQADFIMLIVIDDELDTIQPIQISRDTMTDITVLNVMGSVSGTRYAQICLAHSFGDGREQSCELLAEAVSGLMAGIEISDYYVMNLDGIAAFNDALGGVEVTLAEDFSEFDAEMAAGETIVLDGAQAELYVRGRTGIGDQTDGSRQQRQQQFMEAALDRLAQQIQADSGLFGRVNNALGEYAVTDMSLGRLINIADLAAEYEILPIVRIEGESVLSDKGYMEFYPDEDLLMKTVVDTFYQLRE